MVTRPLMDSIASVTRPSWRSGAGSRHWLKHAKRAIISGMGGCSLCRVGLGNPSSTLGSVARPQVGILFRGSTPLSFGEGIVPYVAVFCDEPFDGFGAHTLVGLLL